MDDITTPDNGFQEIQSRFDAPAYVRRARQVEEALDALVEHCRRQRVEMLEMVRTRLAMLHALAGGAWDAVRPFLAGEEQVRVLQRLHSELGPKLRIAVEPTSSPSALRGAVHELQESVARFNRRWRDFLRSLDMQDVNKQRAGYNRYFLLEKECALRSPRLARIGYRPLEPLTAEELEAMMPPLPELLRSGQGNIHNRR